MNLTASILFLFFAVYVFPENFFNIPIFDWSLKIVFKAILSAVSILYGIEFFVKSLSNDKIWPWNWTIKYFINLCIKVSIIILIIVSSHYMIEYRNSNQTFSLIFCAICILVVIFSPEFNFLEEKEQGQHHNK